MNQRNILFYIMLFASVASFDSCKKSDDATPATPTISPNLEKVTAAMVGTWVFKSVTVTQIVNNKTATTTVCEKYELKDIKFTDKYWDGLTPLPDITFKSNTNVSIYARCMPKPNIFEFKYTLTENNDNSVTFSIPNTLYLQIFNKDITRSSIKAYFPNKFGYIILYDFERK